MNISPRHTFFTVETPFSENWLKKEFEFELKTNLLDTQFQQSDIKSDKAETNQVLSKKIIKLIDCQRKVSDLSTKVDELIKSKNYFQKFLITLSYKLHLFGWKKYSLLATEKELQKISLNIETSLKQLKTHIHIQPVPHPSLFAGVELSFVAKEVFQDLPNLISKNHLSKQTFPADLKYLIAAYLREFVNYILEQIPDSTNLKYKEKEGISRLKAIYNYQCYLSDYITKKQRTSSQLITDLSKQFSWTYEYAEKLFLFSVLFKKNIILNLDYLAFYEKLSLNSSHLLEQKDLQVADHDLILNILADELIEKIRQLTPENPSFVFPGGFLKSHTIFIQINRVNDLYQYIVCNTGLGIPKNHEIEIKENKIWVFPLKVTDLTFEAIANKKFFKELLFSYLDYSQESLNAVQSSYNLCEEYLIKKGKGKKIKSSVVSYPTQIRRSCAYSAINMLAVQTIPFDELENIKKSTAIDFLKAINQLEKTLFSLISPDLKQALEEDINLILSGRTLLASHFGIETY